MSSPQPQPLKVVLGTASIGDKITDPASITSFLNTFHQHGHTELDTAAAYPPNNPGVTERLLGEQSGLRDWVKVSTKLFGFGEGANAPEKVRPGLEASRARLQDPELEIYYFHLPDAKTPMEEQARAMDKAYRAGKFRRFGISNFSPEQTKQLLEIAEEKGE